MEMNLKGVRPRKEDKLGMRPNLPVAGGLTREIPDRMHRLQKLKEFLPISLIDCLIKTQSTDDLIGDANLPWHKSRRNRWLRTPRMLERSLLCVCAFLHGPPERSSGRHSLRNACVGRAMVFLKALVSLRGQWGPGS